MALEETHKDFLKKYDFFTVHGGHLFVFRIQIFPVRENKPIERPASPLLGKGKARHLRAPGLIVPGDTYINRAVIAAGPGRSHRF